MQLPPMDLPDALMEGWEECDDAATETRYLVAAGHTVIWQVRVGTKFGCAIWVDVAAKWSNAVEEFYNAHQEIVTVDEGAGRWAVDPKLMTQTNTQTRTERPIRRAVVTDGYDCRGS